MAWSAKLISGSGGIQGYNEWELFYNPSTQAAYKLTYNIGIGGDAPEVLYHTPDNGSPVPVRANGRNRLLFLEMHIPPQTSWDNVLNILAPIARLVGGPDSQALRASTGTAENVKVGIKPDGATNTTYFDVLDGFIDTDRAFTQDVSILNKTAYKITIALTCKPYGYGTAFTLRNDLASSPHFIEDSNADGLADGWATTATAPGVVALSTTRYLIGGKSQQFFVASAAVGEIGLYTAPVALTAGGNAAASIWASIDPGSTGTLIVRLVDGSFNLIQAKELSLADVTAASSSVVGPDGVTWYKITLSGSNAAAADFRLVAIRKTGSGSLTVYLDGAYLQTGTLTAPLAWCSSSALKNRYDPVSTSAATQQQINYLDVWGVPGDLPAHVKTLIDLNSPTSASAPIFSKRVAGKQIPSKIRHFFDSSLFDITPPNAWTNVVDASRINGSYRTCLVTDAVNPRYIYVTLNSDETPYFAETPLRMYAVVRADNAAARFSVLFGAGISEYAFTSENFAPAAINTWSLVDCGIINLTGIYPDASTADTNIVLTIYADGSAGNMLFDGIYFLPVDEILIYPLKYSRMSFVSNGATREVLSSLDLNREYWNAGAGGSLYELIPAVENRIICITKGTVTGLKQEEQLLTTTMAVTLTVTPRTSHLLGTA